MRIMIFALMIAGIVIGSIAASYAGGNENVVVSISPLSLRPPNPGETVIIEVEVPPFSGWLTALVLWFTQCLCLLLYPELFFRHLRGTGFRCG